MEVERAEYKILDHTADIGLEASGRTLKEAFVNAAKGMFAILSSEEKICTKKSFTFELEAASPEELLVAWLNRLLYLFDAEKVLQGHFEISEIEATRLAARVSGEPLDPGRHKVKTYIKAATHHQTDVTLGDVCTVRVIFDV